MDVDIWGWINEFEHTAKQNNDLQRQKLVTLYREANSIKNRSWEESLPVFQQARELAHALNEKCWEVWLWHWICEIHVINYGDMAIGRDETTRLLVEIRKPLYQTCPVIGRCYRIYVDALVVCDPVGYADETSKMIRYMQEQLPLDYDTRCMIVGRLSDIELAFDHVENAKEIGLEYLAISRRSSYRKIWANISLCFIEYLLGNLEMALEYAFESERYARRTEQGKATIAQALAWQALLASKLSHPHLEPDSLFQRALSQDKQTHRKSFDMFIEAVCQYLELKDKPEQALNYRQEQLSWLVGKSQFYSECECRLKLCRLLGRMGTLTEQEIEAAKEVATNLIKPTLYLSKLASVEQGDYSEEWE